MADLSDTQRRNSASSLRSIADILDPPPPAPQPSSGPVVTPGAGGTLITGAFTGRSVLDPAQWKTVFEDDFPKPADPGKFLTTYGLWDAYKEWYFTTNAKGTTKDHYSTSNLSVVPHADGQGNYLNCRLRSKLNTPDGKNWGAAPSPRFDVGFGPARAPSMFFEARVRIPDPSDLWHIANLLWFDDEKWPFGGENDFWEQGALGTIGGFFHFHGATRPNDQQEFRSQVKPTDWHVIGFEHIAGKSYRQLLDGKQYGPTITDRVPSTPGRISLQSEPDYGKTPPRDMDVQYDWITVSVPA